MTIQLLLSDWDSHKDDEMRCSGRQAGWSISMARPDAENITMATQWQMQKRSWRITGKPNLVGISLR
jgi:hypothetical protein